MRRFIALIWRPGPDGDAVSQRLRAAIVERRPRFERLVDQKGLVVYATAERAGATRVYPLPDAMSRTGHGVILGTLFERSYVDRFSIGDAAPRDPTFGPEESGAIARTRGRHLVESYWGRYVAFLFDASSSAATVLRDPSGALPCEHSTHHGVEVYHAEIEDVLGLGLGGFTIDWDHVGRHLHFEIDQTASSGLRQVTSLLPGQRRTTGPGRTEVVEVWDPVEVAAAHVIVDLDEATRLLRQSGVACVAAWASRFRGLVHRLSGGLDSSIILGGLATAVLPDTVAALHYTTAHPDGDEQLYARQAAAHAGVRLIERRACQPTIDAAGQASMPATARPMSYHYGLSSAPLEARLAAELGADGFFSGHGGDEVLGASDVALGIVDHVRRRGVSSSLLHFAMDAALLSRTSLWSVLALAFRHGWLGRACDPRGRLAGEPSRALTSSLRRSLRVEDIQRPGLAGCALPPAKLLHVFATQTPHIEATLAPVEHWLDMVHPFHSQPLVELCLRVPTYLLNIDGRNRGLARAAFTGLVPAEILARNAKGSGDLHHDESARSHIALARRQLLDGALVSHGLLDGEVLESMFRGDDAELATLRPELFNYLYTEEWVRRWQ